VIIRDEAPADRAGIRALVLAAFGGAQEADLVDRLRTDGDAAISLVAVDGERVVGHVLLSRMSAPFRALGLAPVSVLPDRQGTGIGTRLIRAGLERAELGGWRGVFVLGEPAYYRRFGFDPALASGFASPYAGPYLMALALGGSLPATAGRLDHAPAFRTPA
jgi:putative acetyltransferase